MLDVASYRYLTRHVVPGPQDIAYFAPLVLLPISLLIPRSRLSRWQNIAIFIPIITGCSIRAWTVMEGVDVISVNNLLWAYLLIAFQDPWNDFRLVSCSSVAEHGKAARGPQAPSAPKDNVTTVEQSYPPRIFDRLVWVMKLLASIRLDYWKVSRPSHDRLQPPEAAFPSAKSFLVRSAISLVRGFIILDATRAYIEHDEYFFDSNVSISSPLPFRILDGLPPQFFRSMIAGAQAYALIGEMFYLPAALPVILCSLGILPEQYSPHTWPAYFGSPIAIFRHGVRGLWGTFWHQTMRWTTSGPGYAIADALNLRHGGLLRYATISLSAFGFSGIVHAGLVPPEPRYMRNNVRDVRFEVAGFFWVQWIAVTVEALSGRALTSVFGPWKHGSRKVIRAIVNGLWTVLWFAFSLPLLMDAARQLGYWNPWPLPLSLWQWYHGKGLLTWTHLF